MWAWGGRKTCGGNGSTARLRSPNGDSVPLSPGANDNASGVATVLEVARLLAEVPTARSIHFVAFGAEELGLVGSGYYVATRTLSVRGMVNLDMVGHGAQLLVSNS